MEQSGMTGPYLHISLLVPNLEEAMECYGKLLNVRFRPPVEFPLDALDQRGIGAERGTVRYCYSVEGAPYYELIEAVGSNIFCAEQGYGFHHIGMWMDDDANKRAELEALGVEIAAVARAADGHVLSYFTRPHGPLGLSVEYLNRRDQALFERFFETGSFE
jgi:catechol 2,3-dioxygenase-like lactoylglutathione lyase family enzyme